MEAEKFEEHIKKQFQKREIKPSAGSWEKLQERLEYQERPSGSNFRWIAAIAAVAVVFFVIGTLFNSPVKTGPGLVDTDKPEVIKRDHFEKPASEVVEIQKQQSPIVDQSSKYEEVPEKVIPKVEKRRKEKVEEIIPAEQTEIAQNTAIVPKEEKDRAIAEVVREYSIESEVDALLMAANAEIENDPAYKIQTVSANALLNEVEHELDMNFRQKVFEVLKDGFSKAKTAVANRY